MNGTDCPDDYSIEDEYPNPKWEMTAPGSFTLPKQWMSFKWAIERERQQIATVLDWPRPQFLPGIPRDVRSALPAGSCANAACSRSGYSGITGVSEGCAT
jgi:hypothetical protein